MAMMLYLRFPRLCVRLSRGSRYKIAERLQNSVVLLEALWKRKDRDSGLWIQRCKPKVWVQGSGLRA